MSAAGVMSTQPGQRVGSAERERQRISVRIDRTVLRWLRDLSKWLGMSRSAVVRHAIHGRLAFMIGETLRHQVDLSDASPRVIAHTRSVHADWVFEQNEMRRQLQRVRVNLDQLLRLGADNDDVLTQLDDALGNLEHWARRRALREAAFEDSVTWLTMSSAATRSSSRPPQPPPRILTLSSGSAACHVRCGLEELAIIHEMQRQTGWDSSTVVRAMLAMAAVETGRWSGWTPRPVRDEDLDALTDIWTADIRMYGRLIDDLKAAGQDLNVLVRLSHVGMDIDPDALAGVTRKLQSVLRWTEQKGAPTWP